METEIKIQKIGGSLMIIVPQLYCEHLGITEGDIIKVMDDKGKHGKFIAIWKKKEEQTMVGQLLATEMQSKGKFKIIVPDLKDIMGDEYGKKKEN